MLRLLLLQRVLGLRANQVVDLRTTVHVARCPCLTGRSVHKLSGTRILDIARFAGAQVVPVAYAEVELGRAANLAKAARVELGNTRHLGSLWKPICASPMLIYRVLVLLSGLSLRYVCGLIVAREHTKKGPRVNGLAIGIERRETELGLGDDLASACVLLGDMVEELGR